MIYSGLIVHGKSMSLGSQKMALCGALIDDTQDRPFLSSRNDPAARILRELRQYFLHRKIEVHTLDMVDVNDPALTCVLHLDYSWRALLSLRVLTQIPRAKRVLLMMEPSNVNPSLTYLPWLRRFFPTIMTWNEDLVRRYGYAKCGMFVWGDPLHYRQRSPSQPSFHARKFLVAINMNRWAYMPTSTYAFRIRVFRFFNAHCPRDFDLFGQGWNAPRVFYERWTGFPHFNCYRGAIPMEGDAKIRTLETYKFALCIENNAREPGYITEKMIDCLCARCVPIYFGWEGAARYVPTDCFINLRDFRSLDELKDYLRRMDAETHERHLRAIDRFLNGPSSLYFSNEQLFETIYRTVFKPNASSTLS